MADQKKRSGHWERNRFALHLKTIRCSLGLSEQDLADRAGYKSGTMITTIENASKEAEDSKMKDLANALDVSIGQLKGYRKIEQSEKGWPILTEAEKTALFLFAPILEVLDDRDKERLIDAALILCKAAGKIPAWEKPPWKKSEDKEKSK